MGALAEDREITERISAADPPGSVRIASAHTLVRTHNVAACVIAIAAVGYLFAGATVGAAPSRARTPARSGNPIPGRPGQPQKKKLASAANAHTGMPELGKAVPNFALTDAEGQTHSIGELKGRPYALFFFCGCERCQRCAVTWAQLQQSGALTTVPAPLADGRVAPDRHGKTAGRGTADSPKGSRTVVVYMGSADEARAFALQTGLDSQQTLLLTDGSLSVTQKLHVLPCPRAFAIDARGTVRYVNSHPDDAPLKASAATIVTRTFEAVVHAHYPQAAVK